MLIPKIEPSKNGIIVGGAVNSLLTLVKSLNKSSHKINIVVSVPSKKQSIFKRVRPKHIEWKIIDNDHPPQTAMFGIAFLVKSIYYALQQRSQNISIVHGHSGYAIYSIVTYLYSVITRSASIHTIYCPLLQNATVDNKINLFLKSKFSVFFLKKLDLIIAMSNNIAHSLIKAGIAKKKIVIIPNGIDIKKYHPNNSGVGIRKRLNLLKSNSVILFVGNLMISKGLNVLIEAISQVINETPKCKLIMVLELKHKNFNKRKKELYNRINALGISENVIELGMINYMPELMAAIDVVVVPYIDTQGPSDYPLILMEAMSAGKCVIGTNTGGIPELIKNNKNGVLVPPDNKHELANAIINIITSNDLRKKYEKSARDFIIKNYSLDIIKKKHQNIYGKIIKSK
jgi:glycosyltransferase involved in cell wall biosynthesis